MTESIPGWRLGIDAPGEYEYGVVDGEHYQSGHVAYLRCVVDTPSEAATVMQMVDAGQYRGKRLSFSGALQTVEAGWAALWMRVDESHDRTSALDTMEDRPLKGTAGWHRYDVVLDVGEESGLIALGVSLAGRGEVRFAALDFSEVPLDTPTTAFRPPAAPRNLHLNPRDAL